MAASDFEDELYDLEQRILKLAAGDWLAKIDELRTLLALESPRLAQAVLELLAPQIDDVALAGLIEAYGFGAAAAAEIAEAGGLDDELLAQVNAVPTTTAGKQDVPKPLVARVTGLTDAAAEALDKARRMLQSGIDIQSVLAILFVNATSTQAAIESAINGASNAGVLDVAGAANLPVVWIAERDACVTCLAYSGEVANPGTQFPGGLTFGPKSYFPDGLEGPPRHPHCRCHLEPLNSQAYADALKREAIRSVLRGFALPGESMSIRIQAAQLLLANASALSGVPQSVINYAQAAVAAGAFPTTAFPNAA